MNEAGTLVGVSCISKQKDAAPYLPDPSAACIRFITDALPSLRRIIYIGLGRITNTKTSKSLRTFFKKKKIYHYFVSILFWGGEGNFSYYNETEFLKMSVRSMFSPKEPTTRCR